MFKNNHNGKANTMKDNRASMNQRINSNTINNILRIVNIARAMLILIVIMRTGRRRRQTANTDFRFSVRPNSLATYFGAPRSGVVSARSCKSRFRHLGLGGVGGGGGL